jgi:DNA-binding NtrC family response regulator
MITYRILLVDDEQNILSALCRTLMDEPYELVTAISAEEGLNILGREKIHVVISDERMPGMDGAAFLNIVRHRYPETVRMMLTGHASVEATMRAVNNGEIYRFFTKPWDDTMLLLAIRSAVEKFELEDENRRLLKTVKRQSQELKSLEQHYPGISELKRTDQGAYELPEVSDGELQKLIAQCNDES